VRSVVGIIAKLLSALCGSLWAGIPASTDPR
jgi:hypothetical protein